MALILSNAGGGMSLKCGDVVTGSLTGSHTDANYEFTVCYVDDTKVCLLGNSSLGSALWATAVGYTWSVAFDAGVIKPSAVTVDNVKIPTGAQIGNECAGYNRSFGYWTSTETSGTKALWVYGGQVYPWDKTPDAEPVIPFVEITL